MRPWSSTAPTSAPTREAALTRLCDALGIPFTRGDAALARRAKALRRRLGPALVQRRPPLHRVRCGRGPLPDLPDDYRALLGQALPIYDRLRAFAL